MADTPLLIQVDGDERFAVVVVDFAAGQVRGSSGNMTEAEAREYFECRGEKPSDIAKRFESARENKGKV